MKVVRWSTKIIKADNLKPQSFNWGGYQATALCFCPFVDENDYRFSFWLSDLVKHHKTTNLYPNIYELDLSNFQYKTEKELIEVGHKAYYDDKLSDYLKSIGIYITLADYYGRKDIVELRIYEKCAIIIKDFC